MMHRWITGLLLCMFATAAAHAAPFAYAIDGDGAPGNVYRIDLANNSIVLIGTTGVADTIEASSFGSGGTTLYALSDGTDSLYTMNTANGAATLIGPFGFDISDPGMAFCPDNGTMYLVSEEGDLYTVNLATGAGTLVGAGGGYGPTALSCTVSGVLYAVSDSTDSLYTVNRATGLPTVVGPLGVTIQDGGLGMNGPTLLMVADDDAPTNLYQVNTTTGAATIVAQLDAGNLALESMAVAEEAAGGVIGVASIPSLSEWALIALASLLAASAIGALRRTRQ